MEQEPQTLVALFGGLTDATNALHALQEVGVPYANISMSSHGVDEVAPSVGQTIADDDGLVWSLSVLVGEPLHTKAVDVLRMHGPFALGQQSAALGGRDEVERGKTAWGHYVFEPVESTPRVTDAAGTAGTTGVISSGAFSDKANAEGQPSTKNVPDQARG